MRKKFRELAVKFTVRQARLIRSEYDHVRRESCDAEHRRQADQIVKRLERAWRQGDED